MRVVNSCENESMSWAPMTGAAVDAAAAEYSTDPVLGQRAILCSTQWISHEQQRGVGSAACDVRRSFGSVHHCGVVATPSARPCLGHYGASGLVETPQSSFMAILSSDSSTISSCAPAVSMCSLREHRMRIGPATHRTKRAVGARTSRPRSP